MNVGYRNEKAEFRPEEARVGRKEKVGNDNAT